MVARPWSSSRLSCGERLLLRCDGNAGNFTESTSNEYNAAGKLTKQTYEGSNMSYISTYEYDNAGHLVKYVSKNTNKEDNSSETSEITYKYTDNCCESSTGEKTYYKRK